MPFIQQLHRDNVDNTKIPPLDSGETIIIEQARRTVAERCGHPSPVQLPDLPFLPLHPIATVH